MTGKHFLINDNYHRGVSSKNSLISQPITSVQMIACGGEPLGFGKLIAFLAAMILCISHNSLILKTPKLRSCFSAQLLEKYSTMPAVSYVAVGLILSVLYGVSKMDVASVWCVCCFIRLVCLITAGLGLLQGELCQHPAAAAL